MRKVAIIIVNYNGEKDTIECLDSVEDLVSAEYSLSTIVVDNGSKDKFEVVEKKYDKINLTVLRSEDNLGFSGGNNLGINFALENQAEYILFLNNDTFVDKNLIKELLAVVESDKSIGIAAPKIYFAPGYEYHKSRYEKKESGRVIWYAGGIMDWKNVFGKHKGVDEVDNGQFDKVSETDFASGCCFLIKKEVIEKIGMFDEKYFLYYEENDLCQKIISAGFKIVYAPKAVLWHKNAQSSGGSGSALQDYYITRNRLLFGFRYAPLRSKVALMRESLRIFLKGRNWQKQGVVDFYFRKFGKGTYS